MFDQAKRSASLVGAGLVSGSQTQHRSVDTAYPSVPVSKRVFDVVFSFMALVFFLPLLVVIALIIRLREGGPVFFAHERIGHSGKPFRCLKFRTMAQDADERLHALLESDPDARAEWEAYRKLTNDPRVSRIGQILRKTSLDELPQFLNVLRGDMSVVGPRPIVSEEAHYYRDNIFEYKSVRPGITGAWQIGGRSDTSFSERVSMDVDYINTQTLWGDIQIVFHTVATVMIARGAR